MAEQSVQRMVVVVNPQGLHFRPADLLVRAASQFRSQILLEKDGQSVDCRSIMSLLTLGAAQGVQLCVRASGEDAEAALAHIAELFAQGFNELDSEVASPQ